MLLSRQFNQIPYASSDRRRAQRDPRMPSDSALRRIVDEDPTETPASIAEYYDVRPEVVRRALRRLSIRLQSPQRDRKLPDDDTLRQLLEAAIPGEDSAAVRDDGDCHPSRLPAQGHSRGD